MEKIEKNSMNLTKENIEKLKEIFPNVVTEEKVDFEKLRSILGDEIDEHKEKYQFTWPGKMQAIKLAQTPSTSTLRPLKEKSKDWDTTENFYIEGDNLEVLKQLQKTHYNKIKTIYIDPPYNTGGDFVYNDDFKNSIENYKKQTNQLNKSNPDTSGRFHTDWLNMMYPRLMLARNLLSDEGVMFISIDDHEISNLIKICEDIFGQNNVEQMIWDKISGNDNAGTGKMKITYRFRRDHEYVVVCYKDKDKCIFNKPLRMRKTKNEYGNADNDPRGNWISSEICKSEEKSNPNGKNYYTLTTPNGTQFTRQWHYSEDELKKLIADNRIYFGNGNIIPRLKRFLSEPAETTPSSILQSIASQTDGNNELKKLGLFFENPKPLEIIKWLIEIGSNDNDVILDFFSGSGTTANAVFDLNMNKGNRRFIMVQIPELTDPNSDAFKAGYKTICEIGEERIRLAGEKNKREWKDKIEKEGIFASGEEFHADIGFKAFKLDSTNFNSWDNTSEYDEQTIFETATVFKTDRSDEDILYEIMLKYGVFDQKVEIIVINKKKMFKVGNRYMIVCLDRSITESDIDEIIKLEPRVVVFNEEGFKNDNDKINAEHNLVRAGVEEVKCI